MIWDWKEVAWPDRSKWAKLMRMVFSTERICRAEAEERESPGTQWTSEVKIELERAGRFLTRVEKALTMDEIRSGRLYKHCQL